MGEAGAAARRTGADIGAAATALEERAARTRRMADNYVAGAAGEEAVAEALAPLTSSGWFVLHDRVMPTGGNIDHIVVGPGAVVVLDAKAWNGAIEIRDGHLYSSGWSRRRQVEHLAEQADAVQKALGIEEPVGRALVITTQPDLEPVQLADGSGLLGLRYLYAEIDQTPTTFSTVEVERMLSVLLEAFPIAGSAPPAASGLQVIDGVDVGSLFDRANRFLYLNHWRRGSGHRVYLKDEDGEELGFKDYVTDSISLASDDDVFAAAILRGATPTGLDTDSTQLPKQAIDVRGGRLLGVFAKLYVAAMVGSLWEKKGKRRLYGSIVTPTDGVIDLGYVDLDTGWVKPNGDGPVSRDRGPAERYLALLRDRCPY